MTGTLEIEMTLGEIALRLQHYHNVDGSVPVEIQMAISIVKEYSQYRAMELRLQKVYGTCDGLLEKVVQHLEKHENTEFPEPVFKAELLTDGEAEAWKAYKAIGTVEEIKRMQKYSALAEKHGTIGKAIEACAEYEEIGTIEECRKAVEKLAAVCEPEYLGENTAIGCRIGRCRCGNIVRSYHNFCSDCGGGLDWNNVYPGGGGADH